MTSSSYKSIIDKIRGLKETEFEKYYSNYIRDNIFIGGHMNYCKASFKSGRTDGIFAFKNNEERANFCAICEFKKDIKRGSCLYKDQVVQAIAYWQQFYEFSLIPKVIMLFSYNYVDVIYVEDNLEVLDRWHNRFINALSDEYVSPHNLGRTYKELREICTSLNIMKYDADTLMNETLFKDLYSFNGT